jgi:hypothetical protein
MRVTFDTNALADIVSPETSQRATGPMSGRTIRAAIQSGKIQGVFCETLITLEGITNADRSAVFGSTTVVTSYRHGIAPDGTEITHMKAIQARGLGCAQAQQIADEIQGEVGGLNSFVFYLGSPRTQPNGKKSIARSPSGPTATITAMASIYFAARTSVGAHHMHPPSMRLTEPG